MITPKPKTVVELFEGHPERWSKKGSAFECGYMNYPCCIFGAHQIVYGKYTFDGRSKWEETRNKFKEEFKEVKDLFFWNDSPSTTFEMMLDKCKELGI